MFPQNAVKIVCMKSLNDLKSTALMDAWADLQSIAHAAGDLEPDSNRIAFADPEFLLRREVRGIRFQLELLKPDLAFQAHHIENTIVVFGSARFKAADVAAADLAALKDSGDAQAIKIAERDVRNAAYYEAARAFGHLVATYSNRQPPADQLYICTGGGPGVMEAANRGASEAGAPTIGLNITLPHEQHVNPYVTPALQFQFHYFALRKMHFMMRAKAMIAFPGGFGTLDELFEVITLIQTKKATPVPIILFGSDYWQRVLNLDWLVEEGTISPEDRALLVVVDDVAAAWQAIAHFYQLAD
jgi:uncharacterized protein (TIGR00730 family)